MKEGFLYNLIGSTSNRRQEFLENPHKMREYLKGQATIYMCRGPVNPSEEIAVIPVRHNPKTQDYEVCGLFISEITDILERRINSLSSPFLNDVHSSKEEILNKIISLLYFQTEFKDFQNLLKKFTCDNISLNEVQGRAFEYQIIKLIAEQYLRPKVSTSVQDDSKNYWEDMSMVIHSKKDPVTRKSGLLKSAVSYL